MHGTYSPSISVPCVQCEKQRSSDARVGGTSLSETQLPARQTAPGRHASWSSHWHPGEPSVQRRQTSLLVHAEPRSHDPSSRQGLLTDPGPSTHSPSSRHRSPALHSPALQAQFSAPGAQPASTQRPPSHAAPAPQRIPPSQAQPTSPGWQSSRRHRPSSQNSGPPSSLTPHADTSVQAHPSVPTGHPTTSQTPSPLHAALVSVQPPASQVQPLEPGVHGTTSQRPSSMLHCSPASQLRSARQ